MKPNNIATKIHLVGEHQCSAAGLREAHNTVCHCWTDLRGLEWSRLASMANCRAGMEAATQWRPSVPELPRAFRKAKALSATAHASPPGRNVPAVDAAAARPESPVHEHSNEPIEGVAGKHVTSDR